MEVITAHGVNADRNFLEDGGCGERRDEAEEFREDGLEVG
jgi:hypothetical protein